MHVLYFEQYKCIERKHCLHQSHRIVHAACGSMPDHVSQIHRQHRHGYISSGGNPDLANLITSFTLVQVQSLRKTEIKLWLSII